MTLWVIGVLFGLIFPWCMTACVHGHVRPDACSAFAQLWQITALLHTATVLMVAAMLAGPHWHVTWCFGCAIGSTASGVVAALIEWWQRRRRDKAGRQLGDKSWRRIAALVQALRDTTQPRPILQPAPGGAA